MATSLETRIARLEAERDAQRVHGPVDSNAAAARISSILAIPVVVARAESAAAAGTKEARRLAAAARRIARVHELIDIAVARQRADLFSDLA